MYLYEDKKGGEVDELNFKQEVKEQKTHPHHAPKRLTVLLLIFDLVLLFGMGYLIWADNSRVDTSPESANVLKGSGTTSAALSTYTNPANNFTFKYPTSWNVLSTSTSNDVSLSDKAGGHWLFEVKVASNTASSTLDELVTAEIGSKTATTTDMTIGGVEAKRVVFTSASDYGDTTILVIRSGKIYTVLSDSKTTVVSELEAIIDSLAFTK